jgi:hypothetical protein
VTKVSLELTWMFWDEVMLISTATSASSFVLLDTVLVFDGVLSFVRKISTLDDFRGDDKLVFFCISVTLASDFLFSLSSDIFFGDCWDLLLAIPSALPLISFRSSKPF